MKLKPLLVKLKRTQERRPPDCVVRPPGICGALQGAGRLNAAAPEFEAETTVLIENRIDRYAVIALITLLMVGCFFVLRPFLSVILWAVILSFSTWPVYHRIERAVAGRRGLAAGIMYLSLSVFLAFFFYRDGAALSERLAALSTRVGGKQAPGLLLIAGDTIKSVMIRHENRPALCP